MSTNRGVEKKRKRLMRERDIKPNPTAWILGSKSNNKREKDERERGVSVTVVDAN